MGNNKVHKLNFMNFPSYQLNKFNLLFLAAIKVRMKNNRVCELDAIE
jgi:hypothetical protein